MNIVKQINDQDWPRYTERPVLENGALTETVSAILNDVKLNKDAAIRKYALAFDKVELVDLLVSQQEINEAKATISSELKKAIVIAKNNISKFHQAQIEKEEIVETTPGVKCWRKSIGIEKVGLYIPGGTAPLFSTILMLGIPAKIAGCREVVLCTPCDQHAKVHEAILYTADCVGIKKIFKIGGAQAIAAMAFGTESVPQVYKIFGPGNQYVTKAKELVQQAGTAIDMPAGPSELLIIADETAKPEFVAADLLSQAEHGVDSQVVLLSTDENVLDEILLFINRQLADLPRKSIAEQALKQSHAFLLKDIATCLEFSNVYAPEHLILASENAMDFIDGIVNAGSVFVGNYSCESAGDYASGTNHTLPTNGHAKAYSGLSLDSFVKKITFQKLDKSGILNLGPTIELMAETEQLGAHKNAVSVRLKSINNV